MVTVVAPIAGPILGGWITDSYSWPWIFFINVPIGLFAAAVVRQQMRTRPVVTSQPMDYIGLIDHWRGCVAGGAGQGVTTWTGSSRRSSSPVV